MKYSFRNDYSEGAHPAVLQALTETNAVQTSGYGTDPYCEQARSLIREKCALPQADIHFLVGGTQVNLISCAAFLRPIEAVIAPCTGHPLVHETGSFQATGHMVISVPSDDGKLTPQVHSGSFARDHSTKTQPGMSSSNPSSFSQPNAASNMA